MRSQATAPTTVVLLIVMVVAIAVGAIFLFTGGSEAKSTTEGMTNISREGEGQASSEVSTVLARQNCNQKCFTMKQIARGKESDECVSLVGDSEYCVPIDCEKILLDEVPPESCVLKFEDDTTKRAICRGAAPATPDCQ